MFKSCLILFAFFSITLSALAQDNDEKLAVQFYNEGQYEKAIPLFEKLYQKTPGVYYYNYLINSYIEGKYFNEAEKFVKKLMRQDKSNLKLKVELGYVYARNNEIENARKEYEDALKNVENDRTKITELANAFLVRNENDYAVKTYQKGKLLLKGTYTFGMELAGIFEKQLKYEDMIREYLDLLEFDATNYLPIVQGILQSSLANDPEEKKNQALKNELLRRIQANPGQTFYSEMLLWHSIQRKDFEMAFLQAKAIDKRLKQNGQEVFKLGELALSNEDYDIAVQCFEYMILKGDANYFYMDSRRNLLQAEYARVLNNNSHDIKQLEALEAKYNEIIKEYGKNNYTLPLIKDLANLQAFYLDKSQQAVALLNELIKMQGLRQEVIAECKLLLADILLMTGDVWEATLLYSQIEKAFKNAPIASEAKFKNAKLSYYINEFEWAKAQLDVLKASTSKLIANDALELSLLISDNVDYDSSYVPLSMYARADMLLFQNKTADALLVLDSLLKEFPGHLIIDDVLYREANVYLKLNDVAKADSLFKIINEKYSFSVIADDALFKRAWLQEKVFKNRDEAMKLYQEVLQNYPASTLTVEARKKYRQLRGDVIN